MNKTIAQHNTKHDCLHILDVNEESTGLSTGNFVKHSTQSIKLLYLKFDHYVRWPSDFGDGQ